MSVLSVLSGLWERDYIAVLQRPAPTQQPVKKISSAVTTDSRTIDHACDSVAATDTDWGDDAQCQGANGVPMQQ